MRYYCISESADNPGIKIPWEISEECYNRIKKDLEEKGHQEKYYIKQNAWGIDLNRTGIYRWEE